MTDITPSASIRLGAKLTRPAAERAIEAAYADGKLVDMRAERIMRVLGAPQLVDQLAVAIAGAHLPPTDRYRYWERQGSVARDTARREARAALDLIHDKLAEYTRATT